MRCLYRTRPYEAVPGAANALHEKWKQKCMEFVSHPRILSHRTFKRYCREIIRDFDQLPVTGERKPRVGIVGEILVKFLPAANNYLVELLEAEGAEAVVPDLADSRRAGRIQCYSCRSESVLTFLRSETSLPRSGFPGIRWETHSLPVHQSAQGGRSGL